MTHKIKIYEQYADAVLSGDKNFEVRLNDRGYQKGDTLEFNVVANNTAEFAVSHGLNQKTYEITYVHSGLGLADGYVVLAIKPSLI